MKYIQQFSNETDYNNFVENIDHILLAGVTVNNVLQPRIYEPPVVPNNQIWIKSATAPTTSTLDGAVKDSGYITLTCTSVESDNGWYKFTFNGDVASVKRVSGASKFTSATKVKLPNSVTMIGNDAFSGCTSLTSITIPNSVISIGDRAFSNCSSLPITDNIRYADTYLVEATDKTQTTYTIKNSTKFIGSSAFDSCDSLTSITIPDSVTSIGSSAFINCSSLTSITIPNSVTFISNQTFQECTSLTSITIPNSITYIGEFAFSDCTGLKSIAIPDSVTDIGGSTFLNCSGLTSITVGSNNTAYNDGNGSNCIIEKSTNTLLYGCKNTVIPNSITSIGNYAFQNCRGLTSITIPDSVTSIGFSSFSDCRGLTSITSLNTTPPTIESGTFIGVPSTCPIYVPSESVDAYKGAANWSSRASYIQAIPS